MPLDGGRTVCRPPCERWSVDLVEVLAHGIVTFKDGGVRVGGDPIDNDVCEDLLVHSVVPLAGR